MILDDEVLHKSVKNISLIYDSIAEEVLGRRHASLPSIPNITRGTNYTSFLKLHNILYKFNIISNDDIRLYIRSQFEMLWRISKYNNKVIPINMMISDRAIKRFADFIDSKIDKVGKKNIDKYLQKYVKTSLIKDINYSSLSEDISLVSNYLKDILKDRKIKVSDVIKAVIFIETGKIYSLNRESVCPAYLYLNPVLDLDSDIIQKFFSKKIEYIRKSVKQRGGSYAEMLKNKKETILIEILKDSPDSHKIELTPFL